MDADPTPAVIDRSRLGSQLTQIEADLADVEVALARLDAGTYWTCERTGLPLPDALLAERPAARQLP